MSVKILSRTWRLHAAYNWLVSFRCSLGNYLYCSIRTVTNYWSRMSGSSFSRDAWRKYRFFFFFSHYLWAFVLLHTFAHRDFPTALQLRLHPMSHCLRFSRNEKQKDFVDQIESVAYVLCGENPINLANFRQIFHTKGVSAKLALFLKKVYAGKIEVVMFVLINNCWINAKWQEKSRNSHYGKMLN